MMKHACLRLIGAATMTVLATTADAVPFYDNPAVAKAIITAVTASGDQHCYVVKPYLHPKWGEGFIIETTQCPVAD